MRRQIGSRGAALRLFNQLRKNDAGVEIDAHSSSDSYIELSSSTEVTPTAGRERRRSSIHRWLPIGGFGRGAAGLSSTTGLPRRVITTSSPWSARSISFGRWFLASATL